MQALTGLFPGRLLTLKGHFIRSVRGGAPGDLAKIGEGVALVLKLWRQMVIDPIRVSL